MPLQLSQEIRTLGAQPETLSNRVAYWKAVIQSILNGLPGGNPGGFIIVDVARTAQTNPSRHELRILQDNAEKISGLVAVKTTDADKEEIGAQQQTSELPVTFFTTNGRIQFYRLGVDHAIGNLASLDPTDSQDLRRIEDILKQALELV